MRKGRNLPIPVTFEIMNKEKRKEAMFQKGVFQCQSRLALNSSGTEAWCKLGQRSICTTGIQKERMKSNSNSSKCVVIPAKVGWVLQKMVWKPQIPGLEQKGLCLNDNCKMTFIMPLLESNQLVNTLKLLCKRDIIPLILQTRMLRLSGSSRISQWTRAPGRGSWGACGAVFPQ